jgi:hypothetical protein
MGHMSDERYDAKEAYNKNLSPKSRMHYLENNIADRKGHSGSYSGNHPRFSQGISMMGDPNDMGQAQADLKDNTMVNIEQGEAAGQSSGVMDTAAMMKKGMDKATGY